MAPTGPNIGTDTRDRLKLLTEMSLDSDGAMDRALALAVASEIEFKSHQRVNESTSRQLLRTKANFKHFPKTFEMSSLQLAVLDISYSFGLKFNFFSELRGSSLWSCVGLGPANSGPHPPRECFAESGGDNSYAMRYHDVCDMFL